MARGEMLEIGRDHQLLEGTLLDEGLVEAGPALAVLRPRPEVRLPWGSASTASTRLSAAARLAARFDGGRGLAHPTLLVGDRDRASQVPLRLPRQGGRIAQGRRGSRTCHVEHPPVAVCT